MHCAWYGQTLPKRLKTTTTTNPKKSSAKASSPFGSCNCCQCCRKSIEVDRPFTCSFHHLNDTYHPSPYLTFWNSKACIVVTWYQMLQSLYRDSRAITHKKIWFRYLSSKIGTKGQIFCQNYISVKFLSKLNNKI